MSRRTTARRAVTPVRLEVRGRGRAALVRRWTAVRDGVLGAERDRGSGAGAVIVFALVFLTLAAFVVDGGMSIAQRERAADIAEQAARYAAMDIDEEALREGSGTPAPINYENCQARVAEYAVQAGVSPADIAASGCTEADAEGVAVRIQLTYEPVLTGIFYSAPVRVHGTARAVNETG
ncbi:hypothetical protein JJV70_03435 [Streptomyces sp. JJ66]|uniref:pilus assembly protein TadG-related protein n=1 Tax=Streptomyces sp. JJ66 TaxID=2803843 RepID=UPI001C599D97|nr:pilus assembly protein TadG-related protein [Streptomyces sp. JJ66]MBW1601170.1 hypothetical protein [Streptomyces sp. JJ66]